MNNRERSAFLYGKEAAANDKTRSADNDNEFTQWVNEGSLFMELENEEYYEFLDNMINSWEDGYDAYKRGEII